jgi:hypothetical protein
VFVCVCVYVCLYYRIRVRKGRIVRIHLVEGE